MATRSFCECGREPSAGSTRVALTCDVCGTRSVSKGPYVPTHGVLELGHRWRLDLCPDCIESLIARAPEALREGLRRQAFGETGSE